MKQHSQQNHSAILEKKTKGGQTAQFQIFKDEHFLKHKKEQLKIINTQHKMVISSNIIQYKTDQKNLQSFTQQKQHIHFRTQIKSSTNSKSQIHSSQQLSPQIAKFLSVKEKAQQSRLQRYERVSNSEIKVWGEIKADYQVKYSNQKIGILKKIIQHYNIKSMQKSFESNLMSKQSISHTPQSPVKNKFVSVKKVLPKSAVRRQTATRNDFTRSKLKGYLNLQGLNLFENYLNPISFHVEAQSINDLIKDCHQNRSRLNKTAKQPKIERLSKEKKPSFPGQNNSKGHKFQTLPTQKLKTLETLTDNCINVKINKFKEFIFMINFAHKVYRELDIPKYSNNFKIFIGKGNNCNLIKAIMKRRFWFQITKNIEQANFVWTQLKQQSLYEKQNLKYELKNQQKEIINLQTRQSRTEQSIAISKNTLSQQHQEEYLSLKNLNEKNIQYQVRERKDMKVRKYKEKNSVTNQPEKRILTKQQIQNQKQLIDEILPRKRTCFNERVKYLKGFKNVQFQQLGDELIHNHLSLNGLLGNKKAMFYMLRQYYKLIGKKLFQNVPLTFHIKKGFLDEQYKQFMIKFTQNKSFAMPNYWIIKPGEFSNRGQGISCTNKLEDIRGRVGALKNAKNKSLILQQYITKPLLYYGRKFDIRTFMLVTINNRKLRGYWYQDGYIRTSSYTWTLDEITDNYIHLTNDAIQKNSSKYGKFQPGNKLTYSELQRYLDSLPKKNDKEFNFQTEIYPKIKQIATDAIKSSFCFIDPSRKGNNFQIFGFDFMIDIEFKPWLIQINTNPCLEMSCPVLDRIIPSMVQNAFRIGLDPIIPPPMNYSSTYKYSIPENALHYNKFQVIFDEQRDGAVLNELYANNDVVKLIDEYQQDKEIYEEEGQEITLDQQC